MFKKLNVNGYDVLFHKNNSKIGVVRAVFNVGSMDETPSNFGVAHFLEHMMFKGTEKRDVSTFQKEAAKYGNINAYTDYDVTCYCTDFLTIEVNDAFELFFDMIFNTTIPKDEVERERGVILEELQTHNDDPDSFFYQNVQEDTFGQVAHPILGTVDSLNAMTKSKIDKFKKDNYTKNNMVIVVVGSVPENKLISCLEKNLPISNVEKKENKSKKIIYNWDDLKFSHSSKQAIISFISRNKPLSEFPENRFIQSVFNNGFGGGMHSLLFSRLRESLGLCYSVYSAVIDHKNFSANVVTSFLDKKNVNQAKSEINKIIDEVKNVGFEKDFLTLVKKSLTNGAIGGFDGSYGIAAYGDTCFKQNSFLNLKDCLKRINSVSNEEIIEHANYVYGDKIKICQMSKK